MAMPGKRSVAIVGSGMAGLVTAFLINRDGRYSVTLFESGDKLSLDSASISIPPEDPQTGPVRIDLPMRAFTPGYYKNLKAMYDYLGVTYHAQPFLFTLANFIKKPSTDESISKPYFTHSSNNHQLPPLRPKGLSLFAYTIEILYLLVWFSWFIFCCTYIAPRDGDVDERSETLGQYLKRLKFPGYFKSHYILPLTSSMATCSHETLLEFPASDLITYTRLTRKGQHSVVSNGVQSVEAKLTKLLDVRLHCGVERVSHQNSRVEVQWKNNNAPQTESCVELFDCVILSVTPDVVGRIYEPLASTMSRIPTISITSVVHRDDSIIQELGFENLLKDGGDHIRKDGKLPQSIAMRTSAQSPTWTEAVHQPRPGVVVTTCPISPIEPSGIIHSWQFTRVLRSAESREVVNSIFDQTKSPASSDPEKVFEHSGHWKNGDRGVFVTGGWAWDGCVLLEGCIVSAMRVANALHVEIPW